MSIARGLVVMLALVLLVACTPRMSGHGLPGTAIASDFSDLPDGVAPMTGDDGVPFIDARSNGVVLSPTGRNGALVGNLPDGRSASYLQQVMPRKVVREGAVFGFQMASTPDGGNGALCLAAWATPITSPSAQVPDAHFHFVVSPTSAGLTYWSNGSPSVALFQTTFTHPLPMNGTPLRVEVVIDGSRATVSLPDGSVRTIVNDEIGNIAGTVANWEYFKYDAGDDDVLLYRIWAESAPL